MERQFIPKSKVPPGWLSRAKLARAAGVTRATVKHYNDLGLLPAPVFTGPNMAYYDPDSAERIRLVRELQSKRHLPLPVIAAMFREQGAGAVERALRATSALEADLMDTLAGERKQPANRSELLGLPEINEEVLDELEALGLLRKKGSGKYDAVSRRVTQAVSVMRERGLTEENGFRVKDLALYAEKLRGLVAAEVRLFQKQVLEKGDPKRAEALLRAALPGADALVLAVRSRILADVLGEWPSKKAK